RKDWDGATAALRRATELDPQSAWAHAHLGYCLAEKMDWDAAVACFRRAIKVAPNYAWAHTALGNALRQKGDPDGAIAEHRRAIALDPKLVVAHNNLGIALSDKGDLDGAIAAYRQALALDPQHSLARTNLGNTQRTQEAARKLPAVLRGERTPDPAERVELAELCCEPWKQLYATAARWFAEAFRARPELAEDLAKPYRYNAACAAAQAGCGHGSDAPPD